MNLGAPWSEVAQAFNADDYTNGWEVNWDGAVSYQFKVFKRTPCGIIGPIIRVDVWFWKLTLSKLEFDFELPRQPFSSFHQSSVGRFSISCSPHGGEAFRHLPVEYFQAIPSLAVGLYRLNLSRPYLDELDLFSAHEKLEMMLWLKEASFQITEKATERTKVQHDLEPKSSRLHPTSG